MIKFINVSKKPINIGGSDTLPGDCGVVGDEYNGSCELFNRIGLITFIRTEEEQETAEGAVATDSVEGQMAKGRKAKAAASK